MLNNRLPSALLTCLSLATLGACASRNVQRAVVKESDSAPDTLVEESSARPRGAILPIETDDISQDQHSIRARWVQKWIKFYTKGDKSRFQRHLDRAEPYRWVVEQIFEEHGVPADLFYLGVIESGFQNHATSHASAVGVWQFIKGTADRYNLEVDRYVDERRDPIRATAAAAKYLKDLYNVFNSWPLAMAAYNAGERRVLSAVMRGKTRNFWELAEKGMLPAETANYVPKILAAMIISKNRARYGMRTAPDYTFPVLKPVDVPGQTSLFSLARASGIPVNELKSYNPHLMRDMTPPNSTRNLIWVTEDSYAPMMRVAQAFKGKAPVQFASFKPASAIVASNDPELDRVGETATDASGDDGADDGDDDSEVAKTAPVVKAKARPRFAAVVARRPVSLAVGRSKMRLIFVKRGENLFEISKRYGLSTQEIKKMNQLKSSQLVVGQSLKIPSSSFRPKKTVQYRVKPGDNLHLIAKRFGKSVNELRSMNSLKRENLYAGETIKVDSNGI